jgi:phosphoribosylaminoimidazolecarboxamide formyltransferase / IMP cyclohydrolase
MTLPVVAKKNVRIRSALLSVTDKTGIVALGQALAERGVRLISTGGTRAVLEAAGLPVVEISQITGNPEAFGGRMKTISFQVASGILFDRDRDQDEATGLKIEPIDLVVANLYAFADYKDKGLATAELIEHVDVGGPTMIRAAAKNFAHVCVLTNPEQYSAFIAALRSDTVSLALRTEWMKAAFALTASYDSMIAEHLSGTQAKSSLRYGENPHQQAWFSPLGARFELDVLAGKELSYNNLVDLDAAIATAFGLTQASCVVVKHENPCGIASGESLLGTLEAAWAGDPVSSFGSVIAFNRAITRTDLSFLSMDDKAARKFVEIVAAPDVDESALQYLKENKNLRVVRVRDTHKTAGASKSIKTSAMRVLDIGTLTQSRDETLHDGLRVVSKAGSVPELDKPLIEFGLHAVRQLKSNAIAIVRRSRDGQMLQLLGMGAGQPNRVKSTELALLQAKQNLALEFGTDEAAIQRSLKACVLTSDAFFPFADGPEHALKCGIRILVEPGGSMRDQEVIDVCNAHQAVLVFSGLRHFKH